MTEEKQKKWIRLGAIALFAVAVAIPVVFYLILSGGKQTGNGNVSPSGGESTTGKIACVEHAFGDWITVREVTCVIPGQRFHACTVCGFEKYERVDPEGHKYEHFEKVDPTCETAGYSAHRLCTVCGDTNRVDWNAIGHDLEQHPATLTCTDAGYAAYETCRRCDYSTYGEEVAAPGHQIQYLEAAAPTCDKAGYSAHTLCERCGEREGYEEFAALGHEVVSSDAIEPTCTEYGYTVRVACTRCPYRVSGEEIAPLGHRYVERSLCERCDTFAASENLLFQGYGDGYWVIGLMTGSVSTTVAIPATYKGAPVYGVMPGVFAWNQTIQTLVFEEGFCGCIQTSAFSQCERLETVILPEGVSSIEDSAFANCTALKRIVIPDTVTDIGIDAFSHCSALTTLEFGDMVQVIGENAFAYCTSLVSVRLPDGLSVIPKRAFYGCTALAIVTLGDGLTEIGAEAFQSCTALMQIVLPESLQTVGNYAFFECISLRSVSLGGEIREIGKGAFSGCTVLNTMHYDGMKAAWERVVLGEYWNYSTMLWTVQCSDGAFLIGTKF